MAQWLNELGVSSAVLYYRLSPQRHPAPLEDVGRAIRLVRANAKEWKVDPGRVGVMGFSAGGHLAACAATLFEGARQTSEDVIERQDDRPDLQILGYPVITLGKYRNGTSMDCLLGENPNGVLRHQLSLERQVTERTPPAFIWHTSDDGGVPVQNSLLYAEALAFYQIPFALHVFPHGTHGLGLAAGEPYVRSWAFLCARWLEGMKFLPDSTTGKVPRLCP